MEKPAIEEANYRHRMPIQIRFNDIDRYGHVNNTAYFSYYDLGKVDYLHDILGAHPESREVVPIIANIQAEFLLPVFFGDSITVETTISRVGHKSFTLSQRAINTQTGQIVSRCQTVMVCYSLITQSSAPIPEWYSEVLSDFKPKDRPFPCLP